MTRNGGRSYRSGEMLKAIGISAARNSDNGRVNKLDKTAIISSRILSPASHVSRFFMETANERGILFINLRLPCARRETEETRRSDAETRCPGLPLLTSLSLSLSCSSCFLPFSANSVYIWVTIRRRVHPAVCVHARIREIRMRGRHGSRNLPVKKIPASPGESARFSSIAPYNCVWSDFFHHVN